MTQMITFRHSPVTKEQYDTWIAEGDQPDMEVAVIDKFPELEDVHIEGRRVVEVSIEMFVELIKAWGYEPITPDSPVKKTLDLL